MGFLDRFKKTREKSVGDKKVAGKIIDKEKKQEKPDKKKTEKKAAKKEIKKDESRPKSYRKDAYDTGNAYRYLLKPMVSEKATFLSADGKYVFIVHPDANKIEIKKAVQKVFNVKVEDVNIINVSGKEVRFGRSRGRTKDWKKAVVTLAPGDAIELYEGV